MYWIDSGQVGTGIRFLGWLTTGIGFAFGGSVVNPIPLTSTTILKGMVQTQPVTMYFMIISTATTNNNNQQK